MYISEIAETSIRGTLGTLFQLLLTMGILFIYVVGSMVSWTTLSILCLFVPIALLLGMLMLPETPVYLLKKVSRCSMKYLYENSFTFLIPLTGSSRGGRAVPQVAVGPLL